MIGYLTKISFEGMSISCAHTYIRVLQGKKMQKMRDNYGWEGCDCCHSHRKITMEVDGRGVIAATVIAR